MQLRDVYSPLLNDFKSAVLQIRIQISNLPVPILPKTGPNRNTAPDTHRELNLFVVKLLNLQRKWSRQIKITPLSLMSKLFSTEWEKQCSGSDNNNFGSGLSNSKLGISDPDPGSFCKLEMVRKRFSSLFNRYEDTKRLRSSTFKFSKYCVWD